MTATPRSMLWCWRCSHRRSAHWGALSPIGPGECMAQGCSCVTYRPSHTVDQVAESAPAAPVDEIVATSWCSCGNAIRRVEWHRATCPIYAEWWAEIQGQDE